MKVTIHRGSCQIGGSCIEVATARTRLILDAGLPLDAPTGAQVRRGVRPRPDIDVPGLFGPGSRVDGVLLSHAHPDHSGLLGCRTEGIPVYMTDATSRVMTSLYLFARGRWIRDQRILREHQPTAIGDCRVIAFPVDHSIAGACAFLIEAEGKRVLYSGDLRLHGRKPGMAKQMVQAVRRGPLDLLIIEGTRLRPDSAEGPHSHYLLTEKAVEEQLVGLIRRADSLVLACFGPTNIDRLVSFFRAAVRAGRQFALDAYAVHVLHMLRGIGHGRLPDPVTCDQIRLLPGTGRNPSRAKAGSKAFLEQMRARTVTTGELRQNPKGFIALARPSSLEKDFPVGLPPKTLAIYSMWNGYRKRKEWRELTATVEVSGGRVEECHASGHINTEDLRGLIRNLNPELLVPVHTAVPGMFSQLWPQLRVASDGVSFEV